MARQHTLTLDLLWLSDGQSEYIRLVSDELGRVWTAVVLCSFKVVRQILRRRTEEYNVNCRWLSSYSRS